MNDSSYQTNPKAARVAEILLKIEAVHFRPHQPFILASGKPSPVYVDCRRLISFPKERDFIISLLTDMIVQLQCRDEPFDCVAGGETAGIPYAAFVANSLGLPMSYIRKKPKGYGRNAQIEGIIERKSNVLLIEDLATDGGSKLRFMQVIKKVGAKCNHATVILGYGIFPQKEQQLLKSGLHLHRLCCLKDVFNSALDMGRITARESKSVAKFIDNPENWQQHYQANE